MKKSLLFFPVLLVLVVLAYVIILSPMPKLETTQNAPIHGSHLTNTLRLPIGRVEPIESEEEKARLAKLKADRFFSQQSLTKEIEDRDQIIASDLNARIKKPMEDLFKQWGLNEQTLQKTLDVLHKMDLQNAEEVRRRNRDTPSEVGDRKDLARVKISQEKHALKREAIVTTATSELLVILGSMERVAEVTDIKYQILLEASGIRSGD